MRTKPTLTDEEIRSHMDFDKLLQLHKADAGAVSTTPKWLKITGFTASVVIAVTAIVYSVWPENETESVNQLNQEPVLTQVDSTSQEKTKAEIETKIKEVKNDVPISNPEPVQTSKQPETDNKINKYTDPVFVQAEPINGYPDLYSYFNRELKYPIDALKDSVEGIVSVSFAINEEGKPSDIRINNSLGELFDQECKRVIENMPAWRAATLNGVATTTRMSIPLTFKINYTIKP